MRLTVWVLIIGSAAFLATGCRSLPAHVDNPTLVGTSDYDTVWNTTIEVVEYYFDVVYENRYDGRIETQPVVSATFFEPWLMDVVTFRDRMEATLQTIRRRAFVLVQPSPTGGFTVAVEVYKELENSYLQSSTFIPQTALITSIEPVRESLVTSAVAPPAGWISMGRDSALEDRIIDEIHKKLGQCACPAP